MGKCEGGKMSQERENSIPCTDKRGRPWPVMVDQIGIPINSQEDKMTQNLLQEVINAAKNKSSDHQTVDSTLAERGNRYGDFLGHATITDDIKQAMQRSKNWANLAPDQREALDMVAHKIGRILNGDPDYLDSWHDIIGYARLVEKRLNGEA